MDPRIWPRFPHGPDRPVLAPASRNAFDESPRQLNPFADQDVRDYIDQDQYASARNYDDATRLLLQDRNPGASIPHGALYHREMGDPRVNYLPAGTSEDKIRELLRYRATEAADPDYWLHKLQDGADAELFR